MILPRREELRAIGIGLLCDVFVGAEVRSFETARLLRTLSASMGREISLQMLNLDGMMILASEGGQLRGMQRRPPEMVFAEHLLRAFFRHTTGTNPACAEGLFPGIVPNTMSELEMDEMVHFMSLPEFPDDPYRELQRLAGLELADQDRGSHAPRWTWPRLFQRILAPEASLSVSMMKTGGLSFAIAKESIESLLRSHCSGSSPTAEWAEVALVLLQWISAPIPR